MIVAINNTGNYPVTGQKMSFKANPFRIIRYALDTRKNVNVRFAKTLLGLNKEALKLEEKAGIKNPLSCVNSPLKRHRGGFLLRLARKFADERFYGRVKDDFEGRQLVYDIYESVKHPSKKHKNIVQYSTFSIPQLKEFFELVKQQPFMLKIVDKLVRLLPAESKQALKFDDVVDISKRGYAKYLSKNIDKHDAYITFAMNNRSNEKVADSLERYFDSFINKG